MAAVRLFSVWWRAAPVHREYLCVDGSGADSGDDRAEISIAASSQSCGSAAGVDHAPAATRSACHAGAAPEKRSRSLRQTAGQLPLLISLPAGRQWAKLRACLHHAEDGIARDDSNDLGSAVAGAAYHGHLIDIRAQEPLQQTQERLVRRCP